MTNQPDNFEASETRDLREALAPLAAIDPNAGDFKIPLDLPIFPPDPSGRVPIPPTELHWTKTLRRGRESLILRRADVERAEACLRNAEASAAELRKALEPLARLPLDPAMQDYKRADREILYTLGGVSIQVGQIRRARRILGLPGSESIA